MTTGEAMAVKCTNKGLAPGHPGAALVTDQVRDDATALVALLKPDGVERLLGAAGTLESKGTCRIDRQPPPPGGANTQIQLNDIHGDSSIATCVIRDTVLESRAPWPPGLRQHQDRWLCRQVRIALTQSLKTGCLFEISGSFADEDNLASLKPRDGNHYSKRRARPKVPRTKPKPK